MDWLGALVRRGRTLPCCLIVGGESHRRRMWLQTLTAADGIDLCVGSRMSCQQPRRFIAAYVAERIRLLQPDSAAG